MRVLLTGAGSGIGATVATLLHERGEELWLLARSEERASALAERHAGSRVVVADLADPRALVHIDLPDSLDGVVHSAGVVDVATLGDTDPGSLVDTAAVNLVAPMVLTRAVLGPVRRARGTHVFVNSGSGLNANARWASYNASKFGLRGFADALRQEEAEHGVRVTSIYPGRTATPMQERVHRQEGAEYDASRWIDASTVAEAIVRVLDLPRDATMTDVSIRPGPR